MIMPHSSVWRAYDIRGCAKKDITPQFAMQLGRACSLFFMENGAEEIAIGRDARLTSPSLHKAMIEGLVSGGMEVYDIGEVPTPVMYFAVDGLGLDAGVVVTASHNPKQDNGFKFRLNGGQILTPEINKIRDYTKQKSFPQTSRGHTDFMAIRETYLQAILDDCQPPHTKHRIVVDGGNGVAGPWAVEMYEKMGVEVIPLFCDPDGNFPNHHPDPTKPKNMMALQKAVRQYNADLGIGLDGDGDRIGVVSKQGELIFGDRLMALFAQDLLKWHNGGIVHDVKCSMMLNDVVQSAGGFTVMSPTGYPWVQKYMKDCCALMGGEQSSHICFADRWFGFDDALYAGARLLAMADSLDERVNALPIYPCTPELRLPITEEKKWNVIPSLRPSFVNFQIEELDGLRCTNEQGWTLIRPSNTESCISVRVEGRTENGLKKLVQFLQSQLQQIGVDTQDLDTYAS